MYWAPSELDRGMTSGSEDGLLLPESDKFVLFGIGGERGGVLRDATAGLMGDVPRGLKGGVELEVANDRAGRGGC